MRKSNIIVLFVQTVFLSFIFLHTAAQAPVLVHSHNDYLQDFPLSTALRNDIHSIEVDIFLVKGKLVVGHDHEDLDESLLLKDMYLTPIEQLMSVWAVTKGSIPKWLFIDIKEYEEGILDSLHTLIKEMDAIFLKRQENYSKPMQLVLSGDYSRDLVASNHYPYFFLDGRPKHLENKFSSEIMPVISIDFEDYASWDKGWQMDKKKWKSFFQLIKDTHNQNKKLRFWKTPDEEELWSYLINLKIDVIAVDDIDKIARYLSKRK